MFILLQVLAGQSLPPLPRPLPVLPVPPLSQTPGGNNPNSIDQGEQDINPDIAIIRQRLNGIRQEEVLARRQVLRQGTPMGLFIDGLNRANRPTQFQADGSYRDLTSNTDYHYQFDRAFYNSSGQVLRPGTNTWTPVSHGLLNSTRLIGMLDLVPNPNRSYTFVRSNLDGIPQNPAVYFLQPDGNLFRTAGMEDGRNVPAGIFSIAPNGSAQFNQTNTHMPGTDLICRGSFQQTGTPRVFVNPNPGTGANVMPQVYILPNGGLLHVRPTPQNNASDIQILIPGASSFQDIGQVNPLGGANPGQFTLAGGVTLPAGVTNADIQRGIDALRSYRNPPVAPAAPGGIPSPN